MVKESSGLIDARKAILRSAGLGREVAIDIYGMHSQLSREEPHLLLINDGQNLPEMDFARLLDELTSAGKIHPLVCVGIYAGQERKQEYGTARVLDYEKRGSKAMAYNEFILKDLLPFLHSILAVNRFKSVSMAGFSLGGLTAIDMVWHHPELFSIAGVFSGSLWWRTKSLGNHYDDDRDRIMHAQIRADSYKHGLRFYFTTGSLDETADRNNNGIIDCIDDTLDLIKELKSKGYTGHDVSYINYEDGRHDIATWGRSMSPFLEWGWGKK